MEKSYSKFLDFNNSNIQQKDENGNVLNGLRVFASDYDNGETTLLLFKDGLLDGDLFDDDGNLIMQKPAVEGNGHQEYWRKGKLHRDNGEPAVLAEGFTVKEWWVNGERQPEPNNTNH